jgi:hypothetical protein
MGLPWTGTLGRSETLIEPRVVVPRTVIESESGVAFLYRLNAGIPAILEKKIQEETLKVIFDLGISSSATGASSEHMLMNLLARTR